MVVHRLLGLRLLLLSMKPDRRWIRLQLLASRRQVRSNGSNHCSELRRTSVFLRAMTLRTYNSINVAVDETA